MVIDYGHEVKGRKSSFFGLHLYLCVLFTHTHIAAAIVFPPNLDGIYEGYTSIKALPVINQSSRAVRVKSNTAVSFHQETLQCSGLRWKEILAFKRIKLTVWFNFAISTQG